MRITMTVSPGLLKELRKDDEARFDVLRSALPKGTKLTVLFEEEGPIVSIIPGKEEHEHGQG